MNPKILQQRAKAFDYLFDAVVVTDLKGTIIDWNKGAELLYGYTREEALGQPVNILHVPEDSDKITEEVISTVNKSGKWTGEIRMLHKDGHIGWIESMCVPIYDDNEQMIGALGINRDITERIKEVERLHRLAHYDQLTGIPNRCLLRDRVSHLMAQSQRHKNKFALLYIDLDRFKAINDAKGHEVGDQLLQEAASRLEQCIRHSDTIARIGGDEFALVLENLSSKEDITQMAEALIKILEKPFILDGEEWYISCSIGIAIYPDNAETTVDLFSAADAAMYKAKHKGRATYEF